MSSVVALTYVGLRTTLRSSGSFFRRPLNVLTAVMVLGGLGLLVYLGTERERTVTGPAASAGAFLAALGLVLVVPLLLVTASARCPLRLRSPDVSWLFPVPGSARGLVAYKLLSRVILVLLSALAAASFSAAWAGTLSWRVVTTATAVALLAGSLRALSYLVYFATVKEISAQFFRVVAGMLIGIPAVRFLFSSDPFGPGAVLRIADSFEPLFGAAAWMLGPMFGAVRADPIGAPLAVMTALFATLGTSAIAAGTGYQDGAARVTWETEAVVSAMRGVRPSDLGWGRSTDVRSFERLSGLSGDWAFLWRSVAQARREVARELPSLGLLVGLSLAASLWLPALAPVPFIVAFLGGILRGVLEGMAEELGRSYLHTIPGTPLRRVLAVSLVPALRLVVTLVITWIPVVAWAPVPGWLRWGVLPAAPLLGAVTVLANGWAALRTRSPGATIALSGLVVLGVGAASLAVTWALRDVSPVAMLPVSAIYVMTALVLARAAARSLPLRSAPQVGRPS